MELLASCQPRWASKRRVKLDFGKIVFTGRAVKHWKSLPREAAVSPPLEVLGRHGGVVLWDWFSCRLGSAGLMVGPDDLRGLFPSQ